jgi:hypothetical protein
VPFLLSLGIAATLSFLCLVLLRLGTRPSVSLASWRLARGGRVTAAGKGFAVVMVVVLLFVAHSAVIRWNEVAGDRLYRGTAGNRAAALDLDRPLEPLAGADLDRARRAVDHLERSRHWGLFTNPQSPLKLAWLSLLTGQRRAYDEHLAAALVVQPYAPELHMLRGRELADRGLLRDAAVAYATAVELAPAAADGYLSLGMLLARVGDLGRADEVFERGIAAAPGSARLRYNSGVARALEGDTEGAAACCALAGRRRPSSTCRWSPGRSRLTPTLGWQWRGPVVPPATATAHARMPGRRWSSTRTSKRRARCLPTRRTTAEEPPSRRAGNHPVAAPVP